MFIPETLQKNSYRILRLSANATLSEIHKAAADMRRSATLGLARTIDADVPALGTVPRSLADISSALGRLTNVQQRLVDRLFWFHRFPVEGTNPETTTDDDATPLEFRRVVQRHDEALRGLIAMLQAEIDSSGTVNWVKALCAWYNVVSDGDYWAFVLFLEKRGNFEPLALPSDIKALNVNAVRLAAEPLNRACEESFRIGDTTSARKILCIIGQLENTGRWAIDAKADLITPEIARFRSLCLTVRKECASDIVREESATSLNKVPCDKAIRVYKVKIIPALDDLLKLLHAVNGDVHESLEQAACCLYGIAMDYSWSDNLPISAALLEKSLRLAKGTSSALMIQQKLEEIRPIFNSAHKVYRSSWSGREIADTVRAVVTHQEYSPPSFGAPIRSVPSLKTITGCGFKLYGRSDYDLKTQSCIATRYLVLFMIPVVPLARYRVVEKEGGEFHFLGKLPLTESQISHQLIIPFVILFCLLVGLPFLFYNPRTAQVNRLTPARSQQNEPYGETPTYDAFSQVKAELDELESRIEAGRTRMELLEANLKPVTTILARIDEKMKELKSSLDTLDHQEAIGLEIDIARYNEKVSVYNDLLATRRKLIRENLSEMGLLEKLAKEDKQLVARYNALIDEHRLDLKADWK